MPPDEWHTNHQGDPTELGPGAIKDLMTGSLAIHSRLQKGTRVPAHAIVGSVVAEGGDLAGVGGPIGTMFKLWRYFHVTGDLPIPELSDLIVSIESQSGGMLEQSKGQLFDHIHFDSPSDIYPGPFRPRSDGSFPVGEHALRLLNSPTDSVFFRQGFPTEIAPPHALSMRAVQTPDARAKTIALNGMQITSPGHGANVAPGQAVAVTVQPTAGVTLASVLLLTTLGFEEKTVAPFTFTLQIPSTEIGPLTILALGKDSTGGFLSDQITINVQPSANVQSLNVTPSEFHLPAPGSTIQLTVTGLYADGIERNVTSAATDTTYGTTNPAVATVDVNGLVTGQGQGSTTITVAHGTASANVLVTVTAPAVNTPPVADAGTNQTVVAGQMVVLNGTGSYDPDLNPVTYSWNQTGGPTVVLVDPDASTAAAVLAAPGTYTFRLVVNDGAADGQPASVTVLATFADVASGHPFLPWVQALFAAGITGGCGTVPPQYCPGGLVTRAQMAVFLLRGIHGAGYQPPVATGTMFVDVPGDHAFVKWIEELARERITGGCSASPPQYCPANSVTRGQMAVFLLKAKHGSDYLPPPATGRFADVPTDHPFARWIEQLAQEGVTGGCGTSPARYCPGDPVTRGQMAVFLVRAFGLPL